MFSFLLSFLFVQCSNNKDDIENESLSDNIFFPNELLTSSPRVDVKKKDLPEWLVKRIDKYEDFVDPVNCIKIFRGNWNNRTVYYIYNSFNSCLFCELYYENGTHVELYFSENPDLSNKLLNDLFKESKNWVILYEFGSCYY